MFAKTSVLAVLALVSAAAAMPQPTMVARDELGPLVGEESAIDMANYPHKGGAVVLAQSAATPTPAPTLDKRYTGPLTIRVINSFGADVYTVHAHNADGPGAVSGVVTPGVLAAGATAAYAVPTGWAGNIAVVQNGGGRAIVGDESLIEGSYVLQGGSSAVIDIDVSYVSGFSVPIVCSCDGKGVVTGCNKPLWTLHTCGNDNGVGSCRNPMRGADYDGAVPSPFFAPCQHAAFTVPRDPGANANGICTSGTVTCCIGRNCPANPNQS